ncbi:MAG: carbon monoxide dehydrogenase subunit G [Pseudomonadota bacterium]
MDIAGEYRLAAPRQQVWDALHEADTLQACIPGCESLERVSDEQVNAVLTAAIGPVKSRFKTTITLTELHPPARYTMHGEGKGGAAGFGRGTATVELAEDGAQTVLTYAATLKVGGKLAQVGSRLVVGVARKISDQFFDAFAERIGADTQVVDGDASPTAKGGGSKAWLMVAGGAVALGTLLFILFGRG